MFVSASSTRPANINSHILVAVILVSVWTVVLITVYSLGIFSDLEDRVVDRLEQIPAPTKISNDLALIDIQHIPSDRPWPWPRLDYALILRGLKPWHTQSVVFEMLLHDKDARYSAFDSIFAELVQRENAVLFSAAALRPDDAAPPPHGIIPLRSRGDFRMLSPFGSFFWPIDTYASYGKVGIGNLSSEPNQNLRTVELLFRFREQILPSLSLYAAAIRLNADIEKTSVKLGREIILRDKDMKVLRRIPIDEEGQLRLRFRRPVVVVPRIDSDDLVLAADQAERGVPMQVELKPLEHRQVWVGATDLTAVPAIQTVNGLMPPVLIQMQATHQILAEDYLHPLGARIPLFVFLIWGIFLSRGFVVWGVRMGLFMLILASVFILGAAVVAFQFANICFPIATTLIFMVGVVWCGIAARKWELPHAHSTDSQLPLDLPM